MSTRSRIGLVLKGEKKILSVYCHWDGYLSYNGALLLKYYTEYDKVLELVKKGNMSNISREGVPNYYTGTDGDFEKPIVSSNIKELDKTFKNSEQEYLYLFAPDKNGDYRWIYKQNTYTKKPIYYNFGRYNNEIEIIGYNNYNFITKYRELSENEMLIEELAAACYVMKHINEEHSEFDYYNNLIKKLTFKQIRKARDLDELSRYEVIKYFRGIHQITQLRF